ncbi:hypothetical protein SASPL_131661 [Salvia splendens]|uniref:FAD-binding FR-type domain-containing protein n=1 Tax=Salvia splendens TaxID=180675 RepID=A0A8X8ZL70_SALSN|nr:ferric reduction oxidase 7, chloroplastic-like [Salvia splendens]KAG6408643.1 hypothetical protein SASPL_131661 [Salvia splendens]
MDEKSSKQPLLSRNENLKPTPNFLVSSTKWILKVSMWVIFIAWAALIFLYPSDAVHKPYLKLIQALSTPTFGVSGGVFLIYSAPVLLIAFLASAYIYLRDEEDENHGKKSGKQARLRLWTMPILVDGAFGVVSAGEVIGIAVFTTYIVWAIYAETVKNFEVLSNFHLPTHEERIFMIELIGLRLGVIGLFCVALLFLPVARGSLLLRLIDIPFEHAARYHVWLGHLTMVLFTLHGLFYAIAWTIEGRLLDQLMEWKNKGVANLPGVISLAAGLLMWVTSLPGVRRVNFELFFYTHQLYVVFVVFMALHIGSLSFCYVAAGIFLFMLDRFLRFCQSRRTVDVLSARSFPCGTLELVLSKPPNLHYNALGWIFLQVRELSWLQWHPFSVSSSPLDGENHLAVLIKVLGDWTQKLEQRISEKDSKLKVSVEGPYGHESAYHLKYENLILVAGGIGISPFLAMLSDILQRMNDGKPCLPTNVLIVWAVKQTDELPLLQTVVGMDNFNLSLNLEIQTYVTRQSQPSLEEGKPPSVEAINPDTFPASESKGCGMSVLVGTGNVLWSGMYVLVSTVGLVATVALVNTFYVNPYNVEYSWYKGLLLLLCMTLSVLVFGGVVIVFWHFWEMKTRSVQNVSNNKTKREVLHKASSKEQQYLSTIRYGQRPDFPEIFGAMRDRWGCVDIGVVVCGPSTLQTSVAKECRTQNLGRRSNQPVFHFNSHSFDL